jgi:hypothetical protein
VKNNNPNGVATSGAHFRAVSVKRRAEHRGQILHLAPLLARESAQATQYF